MGWRPELLIVQQHLAVLLLRVAAMCLDRHIRGLLFWSGREDCLPSSSDTFRIPFMPRGSEPAIDEQFSIPKRPMSLSRWERAILEVRELAPRKA